MLNTKFKTLLLSSALVGATAAPAMAAPPATAALPDESWITISGEVESANPDTFLLDYGTGKVIVEMDDWDEWSEGLAIADGDEVLVTGRIDNDLFETASIEASSVYVENVGRHFFASAADEEDATNWFGVPSVEPGVTILRGSVTQINEAANEFTLDAGLMKMDVDVSALPDNPLDDKGLINVAVGDRVSVTGRFEDDMFTNNDLLANALVVFPKASSSKSASMKTDTQLADSTAAAPEPGARIDAYQLPKEVKEVASKADYTADDLAKAELEALQDAS